MPRKDIGGDQVQGSLWVLFGFLGSPGLDLLLNWECSQASYSLTRSGHESATWGRMDQGGFGFRVVLGFFPGRVFSILSGRRCLLIRNRDGGTIEQVGRVR